MWVVKGEIWTLEMEDRIVKGDIWTTKKKIKHLKEKYE